MHVFKIANLFLGTLGGISGIVAAYYWWKASDIPVVPAWGDCEPVDTEDKMRGWAMGTLEALMVSSRLNKRAAQWTAISVLLSTASCFFGGIA
jgi:hypothetical protein